ncbi:MULTISPECIES: hypothetical protein [unclassified Sinorhizobium]|uniref:hypothetical protein n=1 Tax=unclassified Sinorhizobium TaxID=2613772 RepID=UPI0035247F9D
MKLTSLIATAIGMAALSFQPSFADCVDITGSVNKEAGSGISKDGTHAPLEATVPKEGQKGLTTTSKAPQKEGGTMPMGTNPNQATSDQDVVAQQHGGKSAAATAMQEKCD